VDFVEICNVYVGKMIIKAAKRIFHFDKICRSYSDLNFGVTFYGTVYFLPRCIEYGAVSQEKAVRLSVKRVDCDKTEIGLRTVQMFIRYERAFGLVF